MIFFKYIRLLLIFIVLSSSAAMAATLNKNFKIELLAFFPEKQLIAVSYINNKEVYRIGKFDESGSPPYNVGDLGLSYITHLTTANEGVYVSGEVANKKSGENTNYTGRTVLLNANNKLIQQWNYDLGFNSIEIFNDEIIGSTGNKILHLLKSGEVKLLHQRKRKTLISLLMNKQGDIIICNPLPTGKAFTPVDKFGCYNRDKWEFTGHWNLANRKQKSTPVRCGKWIIEANEKIYSSEPIEYFKVRDINTAEIEGEGKISNVISYNCIDEKHIITDNSNTVYSLPDLKPAYTISCYGNEKVKSVIHSGDLSLCLTAQGHISKPQFNSVILTGQPHQ